MGDWVPCRGYGSFGTLSAGVGFDRTDILLLRHGSVVAGTGGDAQIDFASEIVVKRTIGQIQFVAADNANPVVIAMRLRVALYDDALDQTAFYTNNLFNEDGAEEPFLWQRYFTMAVGNSLDVVNHPWWSSMDVRVARKLPRDQALFLSIQILIDAGDATLRFAPYIRCYASPA